MNDREATYARLRADLEAAVREVRAMDVLRMDQVIDGSPFGRDRYLLAALAQHPQARYVLVVGDAINVLSVSWNDANSTLSLGNRVAGNTTEVLGAGNSYI
mgnify:CR=1 FL=1